MIVGTILSPNRLLTLVFCLLTLTLFTVFPSFALQQITWIEADPKSIFVSSPTTVTVTTKIEPDQSLIASGVNLIRYDSAGKALANLGTLYDDGTHGDALPGDNIFTTQITFNEAIPGTIYLKASVPYKGLLKRIFSAPCTIQSEVRSDSAQAISSLVTNLRTAKTDAILQGFSPSDINTKVLAGLDSSSLTRLADWFDKAQVIKDTPNYKVYSAEFVAPDGSKHIQEFILSKNAQGEWKIISW
jgi:hypothetical protein